MSDSPLFEEIAARYPDAFATEHRYRSPCDHRREFDDLHARITAAAGLAHRHIHHVQETIMAALDDLRAEVETNAQTIDNVAIPAIDSILAKLTEGGASEADLAALATELGAANDRLRAKADEAAAAVGGEG